MGKVLCPWTPAAQSAYVSLLDWYLTEGAPSLCLGDSGTLSGLCPLSQATSSHMSPLQSLSLPRPPPQNQLVYTAPRFLTVTHYHPVDLPAGLPASTPTFHPHTGHPASTQQTEGSP